MKARGATPSGCQGRPGWVWFALALTACGARSTDEKPEDAVAPTPWVCSAPGLRRGEAVAQTPWFFDLTPRRLDGIGGPTKRPSWSPVGRCGFSRRTRSPQGQTGSVIGTRTGAISRVRSSPTPRASAHRCCAWAMMRLSTAWDSGSRRTHLPCRTECGMSAPWVLSRLHCRRGHDLTKWRFVPREAAAQSRVELNTPVRGSTGAVRIVL